MYVYVAKSVHLNVVTLVEALVSKNEGVGMRFSYILGGYKWIIMLEKCWRLDVNFFHIKRIVSNHGNWKIKILGAIFELPSKQHCQFSSFGPISEITGLDWHCFLDGSSKTAPGFWFFSTAIGADYLYEVEKQLHLGACILQA